MRKQNYTLEQQTTLLKNLAEHYGRDILTSGEIEQFCKKHKLPYPHFIFNVKADFKVKWGHYRVRGTEPQVGANKAELAAMVANVAPVPASNVTPITAAVNGALVRKVAADTGEKYFAEKDPTYVPFGFYNDLKTIIASRIFYTVYIVGLSGNGKTKMVEQVCAALVSEGREYIRVNITKETDEVDLLGAYDLIDGNTVRRDGPVTIAMKRGAVLLLDEVDLGSERLLCLQPILEGRPFFDKKTGAIVHPAPGFNIIATANTKGKGSDDGRFIGANVLNEAFLERFAITVEQEYAPEKTEINILRKNMEALNVKDDGFAGNLVKWANVTRQAFLKGAADELISTRRLTHIIKAYGIFKNKMKALELCLNRFDDETKQSFIDGYTKVDAEAEPQIFNDIHTPEPAVDPTDALKSTVQQTVMPPAVRPAAPAPVRPPLGGATLPTPTPQPSTAPPRMASSQRTVASPISTTQGAMPGWASAQHIMKVTMSMKEISPIEIDNKDPNVTYVTAYGVKAEVKKNGIVATMSPDGVLKAVVDYCYSVKTTGTGINMFA